MSTLTTLTIAEAAEHTGLTAHTLRYYERDGLMLEAVDRSAAGHRRYSEHDVSWIPLITKLRATGMPIREVKKYADLVAPAPAPSPNGSPCSRPTASASSASWPRSPPTCAPSTTRSATTRTTSKLPLTLSALEAVDSWS